MTSAMTAYYGQQRRPMVPRDDAELGEAVRPVLWKFAAGTSLNGPARDRAALAAVRSRFPKALGVFGESALLAVLRQLQDGTCSWCAYRKAAALAGEPAPRPSGGFQGLLGRPCSRYCQPAFEEAEAYRRKAALLAAAARGGPTPTGALWPAGREPAGLTASARRAATSATHAHAPTGLSVRESIALARRRQRDREQEHQRIQAERERWW